MPAARIQPQGRIKLATGPIRKPVGAFVASRNGLTLLGDGKRDAIATPSGGAYVVVGPGGIAGANGSTTNGRFQLNSVVNQTDTVWEKPTAQVTVMAVIRRYGNSNGGCPIFGNISPNSGPYTSWNIGDNNGVPYFETSAGNAYRAVNGGSATIPTGPVVVLFGVYDGANMRLYVGKQLVGTLAITGAITYPNGSDRGPAVSNFWNAADGKSFNGEVYAGALWDVALSDGERTALADAPYRLFDGQAPMLYAASAPAADTALTGAALAVASATGGLTTSIRLAASASALASASASLSTQIALSGAAAAAASASAALSTAIRLAGAASAQASTAGSLTTAIPLSGSAVASASASASLAGSAAALSGAAVASAAASGQLSTQIRLAGAAVAQAAASASLTANGQGLSGAASASANASGALTTSIALSGAAVAQASATGTFLGSAAALSGAALASAVASGQLATQIVLRGAAVAGSSASGSLMTAIRLSGAAVASASASGSIKSRELKPNPHQTYIGRARIRSITGATRIRSM
jgi:hypothetical protein